MRPAEVLSSAEKMALCSPANQITLNGEPASISGVRAPLAKVTSLRTGLSAEWAWPAVRRIIRSGGNFTTN